jgi:hypothetical protein
LNATLWHWRAAQRWIEPTSAARDADVLDHLLQPWGRYAPFGDPGSSPWKSISASSLQFNEVFFFGMSRCAGAMAD